MGKWRGFVATLLRRLARLAGALAGLLLIGLAIGLAVVHLPSVRSRVLDRARGFLEREHGIVLRASQLDYNLLTRSAELRDVSIASSAGGQPFLEADHASITFGPDIFRGRMAIE